MTTTPNMNLPLPTPQGDIGTWGDELNTGLYAVDGHDHSPTKGVPIGVNGIAIGGDLTFNGFAAANLGSAQFNVINLPSSGARMIFWNTADQELYVRNGSGVNIKVTSGSGLNLAAVGGIVGDYGAIGAQVAYDDANDRYTFQQQLSGGVRQWARLDSADVDLYEYHAAGNVTNVVNRVRLSSPASLAASYAMTFPAALPGSTVALQVSSAGAITASNTFASGVTASNGLTVSGGGTFDFSAAGTVVDKSRTVVLDVLANTGPLVGGLVTSGPSFHLGNSQSGGIPFYPSNNDVISAVTFYYTRTSGTITFALVANPLVGPGAAVIVCSKTDASTSTATSIQIGSSPSSGSLPATVDAAHTYRAAVACDGTGVVDVWGVSITYQRNGV